MNELEWTPFELGNNTTISEALEIIEDASCYGFIFKVENHRLYWAEVL